MDGGVRTPAKGATTVNGFHYYEGNGLAEVFSSGSGRWLDLWRNVNALNPTRYISVDDPDARGRKCIAG